MSVWIDLEDYSKKYGVSLSSLRRRVRSRTVPFRLDKGKYLLEDSRGVLEAAPLYSRTLQKAPNIDRLIAENRRLKEQVSELETLIKAYEAELTTSE